MPQGRREEASIEHSVEAIQERRANQAKSRLVKLIGEAIWARCLGGCSSLHSLLKLTQCERLLQVCSLLRREGGEAVQ
jgi:hypothetical protein